MTSIHVKNNFVTDTMALVLMIEMRDRIIAATAKYLNAKLITNDHVIARSKYLKMK